MAEKMEKSSTDPKEKLFSLIKSLGPAGLKEKLPTLSEEEKVVLKAALEELNLKKGGPGSGQKGHTTPTAPTVDSGTGLPMTGRGGPISMNEGDRKAKKLAAKQRRMERMKKSETEAEIDSEIESMSDRELDDFLYKAISFDKEAQAVKFVQGNIKDTIIQEDKADDDADEKLVKPEAAKMNHQGTPTDGWDGQVIKSLEESEDQLDALIEKAMDKCNDEKMVAEKLEKKGMNKEKVQGAIEKYKAKKEVKKSEETPSEDLEKGKMKEKEMDKEEAKDKIMAMEEKEHGTKDPKKLVEAEKKEHKEEKKEMKKSISWEDETRLLKANTLGRNFNFNVEQFIEETLKNAPQETVEKSEDGKEDLNDLIAKGKDKSWDQEADEKKKDEAKKKMNGKMVKSFADAELAEVLGISEEEAKEILGE